MGEIVPIPDINVTIDNAEVVEQLRTTNSLLEFIKEVELKQLDTLDVLKQNMEVHGLSLDEINNVLSCQVDGKEGIAQLLYTNNLQNEDLIETSVHSADNTSLTALWGQVTYITFFALFVVCVVYKLFSKILNSSKYNMLR